MTERIQKFLARAGCCSRRAAEEAIRGGWVQVNGQKAEIGQTVEPTDRVTYYGEEVREKKSPNVVIALNKPRDYICSNFDPHDPQTVFDLLPLYKNHKLFCCGRLDKDSEGLILLTDDGDFAQKVTHPSQKIAKFYRLLLNRPFDNRLREKALQGVEDEGEWLRLESIYSPSRKFSKVLEVKLLEGRKRHIRRLFQALGYRVTRLLRYRIGQLTLDGLRLKVGQYRVLPPDLKSKIFEPDSKTLGLRKKIQ